MTDSQATNLHPYSRIIAGTMTWGRWGAKLSTAGMADLIRHCVEQGISTFDHADIYGEYSTEADFGAGLVESGVDRESIQLITKCGIQMTCREANALKHYDYSKEHILWSAEQSLSKLKTDYLDLFLLHRPSPLMQPDEVAEAIHKLKDSGKIKQFGVSNFTPSQIALLERAIPVSGNQVEFSLLHGTPMYEGTLDDCLANDRLAMAWSPLGGFFKEDHPEFKAIDAVMRSLSAKYQTTHAQLLLAWIIKHPANIHPVIGSSNKERIKQSMDAVEIDLELQDWFALLAASEGHEVP